MPRFARVVIPGIPHHITHRGNRRDDIFFCRRSRGISGDYAGLLPGITSGAVPAIMYWVLLTRY
jgi:hypothetical protein